MTGVRQWAFSVCCAMVACGLAQLLLPKSSLQRVFKLCVSVFFLCCLLSPVLLRSPELRIEIREYAQEDIERRAQRLTDIVEKQSGAAAESEIRKIVEDKLLEMGINQSRITIHINTNGQNEAEGVLVEIILDEALEQEHDKIWEGLSASLGIEVRLGYE